MPINFPLFHLFQDIILNETTVFQVYPRSGGVRGTDGLERNFTTTEGLPTAVRNLTQSAVSATSVTLTWAEPEETNGDITDYLYVVIFRRNYLHVSYFKILII